MDEDRIREIVREEFSAMRDAEKTTSEIETSLYKANIEHHLEGLVDEVHLPDDMREALNLYVQKIMP